MNGFFINDEKMKGCGRTLQKEIECRHQSRCKIGELTVGKQQMVEIARRYPPMRRLLFLMSLQLH